MVTKSAVKAASIIRVDESVKAVGTFHPMEERYANKSNSMWKTPS